jgi:hypothetical protein
MADLLMTLRKGICGLEEAPHALGSVLLVPNIVIFLFFIFYI